MSSDHWNFLANLLGTPGASEPPEDESKEEKDRQPQATSEKTESSEPTDATSTSELASQTPAEPEPESESSGDANVLDALRAAVPQETLPGFGPRQEHDAEAATDDHEPASAMTQFDNPAEDVEPLATAGEIHGTESTESDSSGPDENAWGDLAKELGVEPDNVPPTPRRETSLHEESPAARERSPRSKTRKPSGGFGNGLGIDLGPEPEEPDAVSVDAEADRDLPSTEIADSRPHREADRGREPAGQRPRGGRSGRRRREDSDFGDDRESDRSSSSRSDWQDRDLAADRVSDDLGVGAQRPDEDESSESPQRRRRGRRGARQRVTEEELERSERDVSLGDSEEDDFSRPRRGGRRGQRRGDSGPDRDMPPRRDWDDLEAESGADPGAVRSAGQPEQDLDEEEEGTRSRSRRRGRRGRGRSRRREQDESRRDVVADTDDDPLARPSAFDDDHEDDIEVEVIRRGRRGRSRSRDRDDSSRDDAGREARRDVQRSRDRDEEDRPRSRRWREGSDRDEDSGDATVRRRAGIPTWIETVELLVNANIENHKKSKGGGRGRGGRRR